MPETNQQDDILKRLQQLEEENRRLRETVTKAPLEKIEAVEGEYKGHPTLTFKGPFRHFTLGLTKIKAINECWSQVEAFIRKHSKGGVSDVTGDDDLRI
ncbi:hypothetical protein [Desulfonatronum thioautotrophicum]|uniref:hypothetical protein n=1 Tax=Desulfonatronum thioautotrophicum TaxID=617001 RepID=UPI0005EB2088|nr:hypothetical protein [Desulfonatronum thioautotrophicum]